MSNGPKLTPERDGYTLAGRRYEGFADRLELPIDLRVKIARWATQLSPASATAAQENLLAQLPSVPSRRRRAAERRSEFLSSPIVRAIWGTLDADQQALALKPRSRLGEEERYPLSSGQLARLVGADRQQVRRWGDKNLLPSTRDQNGHREYGAAAVVLAFALRGSKQNDREYYADIIGAEAPLSVFRRGLGLATYYAFLGDGDVTVQELEATSTFLANVAEGIRSATHPASGAVSIHDVGAAAHLALNAAEESRA